MAREFLFFQLEGAYQVPVTCTLAEVWTTAGSGTAGQGIAGFNGFFGRLDGGDSFTMRPRTVPVTVPYGGGFDLPAFTVSDKMVCEGRYSTKLYAGPFSQFLLTWAAQQVNTANYVAGISSTGAGSDIATGWHSTKAPGNLASVSIYHAIQLQPAGTTYKVRAYRGCKVKSWNFSISQDSQVGTLSLELTGAVAHGNQFDSSVDPTLTAVGTAPVYNAPPSASTIPYPATNNLPINPYLFINCGSTGGSGSAGVLEIGTGALTNRTTFQSIGLSCTNRLMTRFWANRFVQFSQFCGRNLTLTAQEFFTNSPDDRTAYEGLSGQSITLTISNGTHSMSFVMNTNNIFTSVEDSLPLADIYTQTLTATSQWDPAYTGAGSGPFQDPALAADFQMAFT